MITETQYFEALKTVKAYHFQEKELLEHKINTLKEDKSVFIEELSHFLKDFTNRRRRITIIPNDLDPNMLMRDVEVSVRLFKCLKLNFDDFYTRKIIDFKDTRIDQLTIYKNVGNVTLKEFRRIFERSGIKLTDESFYTLLG